MRELDRTAKWVVSSVCTVIILISIFLEKFLHKVGTTAVIKLPPCTDRGRAKAMQIAAAKGTVASVSIQGPERDRLVVVGQGIDTVRLTQYLRKKKTFKKASILSVQSTNSVPPPVPHRSCTDDHDNSDVNHRLMNIAQPIDHRMQPGWPSLSYYNDGQPVHGEAYDSNEGCYVL